MKPPSLTPKRRRFWSRSGPSTGSPTKAVGAVRRPTDSWKGGAGGATVDTAPNHVQSGLNSWLVEGYVHGEVGYVHGEAMIGWWWSDGLFMVSWWLIEGCLLLSWWRMVVTRVNQPGSGTSAIEIAGFPATWHGSIRWQMNALTAMVDGGLRLTDRDVELMTNWWLTDGWWLATRINFLFLYGCFSI